MPAKPMNILWVKSGPLLPLDTGGKKLAHAMLEERGCGYLLTCLGFVAANQHYCSY
jgi:hypothetical protein